MLIINDSHIKSLSEYLSKYPVLFAYLFGSQAEGKSSSLLDRRYYDKRRAELVLDIIREG